MCLHSIYFKNVNDLFFFVCVCVSIFLSFFYGANGLNLSNLIGNYLVNFMYLVTNSFDKYLSRIGNSIAFIER